MIEYRCPSCGYLLKAPDQFGGKTVVCMKCRTKLRLPSPLDAGANRALQEVQEEDSRCPVCSRKAWGKCMYCGADLTLSVEEAQQASVDLIKGLSMELFDEQSNQLLSGTIRARHEGLLVTGYAPDAKGKSSMDPTNVALSATLGAMTLLGGPLGSLGAGIARKILINDKVAEGPPSIEFLFDWKRIELIENRGDRVRLTVPKDEKKMMEAVSRTIDFDIKIIGVPGDDANLHANLHSQIAKYRDNPSALPFCPGCFRVLESGTNRCIYCGTTREPG